LRDRLIRQLRAADDRRQLHREALIAGDHLRRGSSRVGDDVLIARNDLKEAPRHEAGFPCVRAAAARDD
jgi:hypothetical protein